MISKLAPFNLDLLILDSANSKLLQPIEVLDIFDGASKNFNSGGLFSTEIFGKYGEEKRNRVFAYINIKVGVFHPIIFKALTDLKGLYGDIMAGTEYAVWDTGLKDFIKSTPMDGKTGYTFFMDHFKDIRFETRPSTRREYNIKVVNKFKDKCMLDQILVMPAGLREYEIDEQGKPSEDEVNTFYRKFISYANLISDASIKVNPASIDQIRYKIQINFNDLYNYVKALLEGKKKLILGKWAARKVFDGTRNVITSMNNDTDTLNSPVTVSYNQTVVGLYQYLKATMPVSSYQIRNYFIHKVFVDNNGLSKLVNKTTLKSEMVDIPADYVDDWMSDEGLEKTITGFSEEDTRHDYVEIGGYYLGLIYKGPDNTFRLMQDIDELPPELDKQYVSPITMFELLYASVHKLSGTYPGFVTRYPITGYGSIYPSFAYLKTTVKTEIRTELDDAWQPTDTIAINWPLYNAPSVNSLSPHVSHIRRLGADFDGDMVSWIMAYTEEAIKEVTAKINSSSYYVDHNGKMNFSASTDNINQVLQNITR